VPPLKPLAGKAFADAVEELAGRDRDLAAVVAQFGPPRLRRREPGYAKLLLLILEQQVSLASARATYERLLAALNGGLTPERFLGLDAEALRAIGFSRQKAVYGGELSRAVAHGGLDLDGLARLDDAAVEAELVRIKGIGKWTAHIYLMEGLGRPDVWPVGDLALAVAAGRVKRLGARPGAEALAALGEPWRPWRAVAARILWHYYLNTVRKPGTQFP
jgi:DNA-3-methyladenine glycosylase II